jgi:deazaflavin-dependent oxidoreductase (nitroreductase family)
VQEEEIHDSPRDWVARHIDEFLATDGLSRGARRRLLLTTRGRRTGKLRRTALYYWADGPDRWFVVGSDGGSARHPAWYLNLTADPMVTVQIGPEIFRAAASIVTGDERTRLWNVVTDHISSYESFERRTSREIPVVVLTRQQGGD